MIYAETISDLLVKASEAYSDRPFLFSRKKENDRFVRHSFKTIAKDAQAAAEAFIELGLEHKKIMIYAENSYEWAVSDLAITAYAGISVPVDSDWMSLDICEILDKLKVSAVIYSKKTEPTINEIKDKYSALKYICIEDDFVDILRRGRKLLEAKNGNSEFLEKTANNICKIISTSGTSGHPKSVPLTSWNILSSHEFINRRIDVDNDIDVCYCPLDLHHIFGNYALLYCLACGVPFYLPKSTSRIAEDLSNLNPTFMLATPSILKTFIDAIPEKLMDKYMKKLAKPGLFFSESYFEEFQKLFGSRMRAIVCSAAKLPAKLKDTYCKMGVRVLEIYGLTEASGPVSMDYMIDKFAESSGVVLEGMEIMISDPDEDGYGEIALRGEGVVQGYYKNLSSSITFIDDDGFFHTGDIGKLDSSNRLYVLGRISRIVIAGNGKHLAPHKIESLLDGYDEITSSLVYIKDDCVFVKIFSPESGSRIMEIVEEVNSKLPAYSRIQSYDLSKETPSSAHQNVG